MLMWKGKLKVTYVSDLLFSVIDHKWICSSYPQGASASKDRIKGHV